MDKEPTIKQLCVVCGKEVKQNERGRRKKYCSEQCKHKFNDKKRRERALTDHRPEEAHICEYCGKLFFSLGIHNRIYCSTSCSNSGRAYKKIHQEEQDNLRAKKELSCETANMEMDGRNETPEYGRPKRTFEQITVYANNPYVKSASEKGIILHENFYIEANSLLELGIDTVLSIFGIKHEKISKAEKRMIAGLIDYYAVNPDSAETVAMTENYHPFEVDDTMLMIMENRMAAMNHLVEERLSDIEKNIGMMTTHKRKEICFMLSQLPEDPWNIFTAKRIVELSGISRSSYYNYIGNERYGLSVVERDRLDEADVRMAFEYKNYKKGVRQVYMLIPKLSGRKIGIDRVRRIMREYGMNSCVRQANVSRQAASKRLAKYCKPNLLQRMFRLHRPNEVRLTDVTYLMYNDESVAYGSALMDPVTGVLIAFVVSENNDVSLATETLRAMDDHPCKDGGIIHSDQGSVYLSDEFQREVENLGIRQSMSKRGNCWDNAPQESFFGHFKDECNYAHCADIGELQEVISEYAWYYNNERGMWGRRHMTPLEYEQYLLGLSDEEYADYMTKEAEKYEIMKQSATEKAKERYKTLGV